MKRKRGTGKPKPTKPSITGAAEVSVDPGYYSDINQENNGFGSRTEIETREVNTNTSDQHVGLDKTLGGAAAKLSWGIYKSRANVTNDRVPLQREKVGKKEPKSSNQGPVYKKQELDAAQSVIKVIMKMDAAEPFITPVDPIALGIPDYFDIIDTPMDFGTICSKLENGLTYRNSEEVLTDVQLIWDNCLKYNKKDSYIVELMKRVKNSFVKQWAAAGLYKGQPTVSNGQLGHNLQLLAESTMRHEEVGRMYAPGSSMRHEGSGHMYPMGSTINKSAYLPQHDWNQMQYPQPPPCCSHAQHDLASQHSHFPHLPSMDQTNGKSCSQWVNQAGQSLMQPRPSPSYSFMGPPDQRAYMHQPNASQIPPSQLQAGTNAQSAGHLHNREHAFNLRGDHIDGYHPQRYQMDPVHMPMHQLNPSSFHHLQSSHDEGGRNIEIEGNLHIPPPTESTANCTKRGSEYSRPPITDKTSCQNLNQRNSTPEQSSSSMDNIEECDPLKKTCQNQPESSPSEQLHSRAEDNNFSKRKTRSQGLERCQEQLSSMMDGQEHQPQELTYQIETESPQSRQSPPTAGNNRTVEKKSRGRGPAKDIEFREGDHIPVALNEQGQPVGPNAQKLVTYLGTLARNGHLLPLTYLDWRAVPFENKESMWEKVQLRFDIDPMIKDWVLQSIGLKWRDWKSKLKLKHYYPYETDEERLADCDERVVPEQWAVLVKLWSTESMQKWSAKNRANKMKQKYNHATGRKSFARIREEQKANRPDGKELSRAELFILTRTRKDGKPVNKASSEVITKLRERTKNQEIPEDNNKQGDLLTEIIGPKENGRARCIELGPTPSDVGGLKQSHAETVKMVHKANSEILAVKEKVTVMEQTCALMASQMTAMMSMMSSMHKNTRDENVNDLAPTNSGASDHSVPQQTSRQTRGSKRRI